MIRSHLVPHKVVPHRRSVMRVMMTAGGTRTRHTMDSILISSCPASPALTRASGRKRTERWRPTIMAAANGTVVDSSPHSSSFLHCRSRRMSDCREELGRQDAQSAALQQKPTALRLFMDDDEAKHLHHLAPTGHHQYCHRPSLSDSSILSPCRSVLASSVTMAGVTGMAG